MNQLTRRARSNTGATFLGDLFLLLVIIGCCVGYAYNVILWGMQ